MQVRSRPTEPDHIKVPDPPFRRTLRYESGGVRCLRVATITSTPLELIAYALAGGAILYVIGEVWAATPRHGRRELGLLMMTAGFLAGVTTDLIVTYAGA